jgi:tetratricopeptide (TPR) repeat protein
VKFKLTLLFAAFLGTSCLAAMSDRLEAAGSTSSPAVTSTNAPVELEYELEYVKLMEDDDAALAEIDGWIVENRKFAENGAGVPNAELNDRIRKRLAPVRQAYEDFLKRNPKHSRARLAFASFLEDIHDEDAALEQMLKAKEVDPENPAAWNNLANYYGHFSPVTNAFYHYEKAIELDPKEPVYYQNFGTTVFLFRKDAQEYYGINEQQVFDKALKLYSNSLALDPTNFLLATDIAMTYYGIKPPRTDDALKAWDYALKLADGSLQREGVVIHLARVELNAGRFDEARANLNAVTNAELADLKARVLRSLESKEHPAPESATNAAPADTISPSPSTTGPTNATAAKP